MTARLKVVKEIINNSVKFYEGELNRLYDTELMNIEVTAKVFKNIMQGK